MPEVPVKKLRVGWFSFSCCEDSTIMMTEMLNDHYTEWLKVVDFVNAKVLRKDKPLEDLDVAFVEGAINGKKQEKQLKEIRAKTKKLVAIGACACTGMPSALRNLFNEETKKEIAPIMARFDYTDKVYKLSELVAVDAMVPGCPMIPEKFLAVLDRYLKEFKII